MLLWPGQQAGLGVLPSQPHLLNRHQRHTDQSSRRGGGVKRAGAMKEGGRQILHVAEITCSTEKLPSSLCSHLPPRQGRNVQIKETSDVRM